MKVRLTENEINAIVQVIKNVDSRWEVYLYGSRTHHDLKGGDIDLLVVVPEEHTKDPPVQDYQLVSRLKKALGERRIDLTLATRDQCLLDPFLSVIWTDAIRLSEEK